MEAVIIEPMNLSDSEINLCQWQLATGQEIVVTRQQILVAIFFYVIITSQLAKNLAANCYNKFLVSLVSKSE